MTKTGITIQPIKTERDHSAAVKRIEKLMGCKPGSVEGDELDMLATLVCAYEEKHFPMDPPEPVAAIQFRMEQQGLTRKDLETMIGSRARVSEVLSGEAAADAADDPAGKRWIGDLGGCVGGDGEGGRAEALVA